ncbi:MAG: glycosyltransferase family 4 protein [Candidatus Aenigmatarchaeota archaeon]
MNILTYLKLILFYVVMRIMICSDSGYPYKGGGETYVVNLGSRLAQRGHHVNWLVSKMPNTKSFENYNGIEIHRVPIIGRYIFPGRHTYTLTSLLPALKLGKKADVIQFNAFIAAINGWAIGKLLNKPYLIMVYEIFQDLWKTISSNPIEKILYPLIESYITKMPYPKILTISNYVKKSLEKMGVDPKLIEVIYLGFDSSIFHPGYEPVLKKKFPDKFIIGWAGRFGLSHSKNLIMLLDAFKLIKKEIPNIILAFDGPDFDNFLPEINKRKLNLDSEIIYNGISTKENLPYFYSSLDVFALPSLSEGFGLSAVEAQACGVPVVCFNKGALPEVISNGISGILVDDTSPEALAENLINILTNRNLRENLAKNAPENVAKFDWKITVDKHLAVYEELINSW